jgi:protein-tyrosine phosphatase
VLYRTGHLAKLEDSDLHHLEQLRIHTLIDLRSHRERARNPDRLPAEHQIHTLSLPVLDTEKAVVDEVSRRMIAHDFSEYDPDAKMADVYRQFAIGFTESYRQFAHAVLAAGGAPVLWHCTAGKDRAGFASALILSLLGVTHADVMQDYLLSARYLRRQPWQFLFLRLTKGPKTARITKTLLQVKECWLQGAFNAINERWGSFESYAEQALKLSSSDVTRLRQTLLDPADQ